MIKVPSRLLNLLEQDPQMDAGVRASLATFEPLLRKNQMPFFPEYTDHSDKHVEEVLVTADAIITDAAHERLKPRDAGILVLAILLHDLGMHISEDGFANLISADQEVTVRRLDHKKWQELWEEF